MKTHLLSNRVGTVAALALAVGILPGCHGDNSNLPPPIIPIPNSIAVADVNGDGVPDLLVATTADQGYALNPGYANVILNTKGSPGTFSTGVHYATTGTNPSSIAVVSLAGSGPADLVIAIFGNGSVSIFMHGATAGTFASSVDVPTGGQPNQVVASSLAGNPNGPPDLVLADMSASGNVIVLMHGTNPGEFLAPTKLATGLTTPSVAVGDLTGSGGAPAIVAATFDASGNNGAVQVFWPDTHAGTFHSPVPYPAGAQPQSVKIADVNGDGLPDIIVADFGPGADGKGSAGVTVLLQDATNKGTFVLQPTYATPGASIDVAVGSLVAGEPKDLVVANLAPSGTGSVSVLLHDPQNPGKFLAATSYPALGQPLAVQIADLNGDGQPDIAIADGPSAGVLIQTGQGAFKPVEQVGF